MRLQRPRSVSDITACVELYYNLNDHSFVTVSKEECCKNLLRLVRQGEFCKVLIDDSNTIVAWILAFCVKPLYSKETFMQQQFFASSLTGVKAVRAVKMLHNEMIEEAIKQDVSYVISSGSHTDLNFTFTRILEKDGWQRRGFLAVKRLRG